MALMLALRLGGRDKAQRPVLDKLRKRLQYAARNGLLTQIGPAGDPKSLFIVEEVLRWARQRFPSGFDDVQLTSHVTVTDGIALGDSLRVSSIPADLAKCQQALRDAQDLIDHLEGELAAAKREIDRLAPLAERYLENVETNRRSAKRPRNQ